MAAGFESYLPIHPRTGLCALGIGKRGPIWPVMGGDGTDDAKVAADAAKAVADKAAAEKAVADASDGDKGYPSETPISEMTEKQQAAYWKAQSRKHENASKKFTDYDDIKAKAAKFDAVEHDLMTDHEKAVADAVKAATDKVTMDALPKLVSAEFRAAAAGRLDAEKMAAILEPLDLTKFLTDNGDVDTDKVSKFVNSVAPAKGAPGHQNVGPSSTGLGKRSGNTSPSMQTGRDLYKLRFPQKTA